MDLGLKGKTALVLGGAGGLGSAIALSLAKEGARVIVADLDAIAIERVVKSLGEADLECLSLPWDLADLAVINERVSRIEEEFGPVDVLVNNTGGPPPTSALNQDLELWSQQFRTMVLSIIAITDRTLSHMRKRRWGRVITSTSSGVVAPIANLAISNALRLSLVGWSKTLAREVAADGITANIIVPGRIGTGRTDFLDKRRAEREGRPLEDVVRDSIAAIPVGRYGKPEEYADTVTYLASTRASYITGAIIRVDGGLISSI